MSTEEAKIMMELIGSRLEILLHDSGMSQTELANMLGVSRSTVNKWTKKKASPRMGLIEKMSSIFGVPKSYFLEETADDKRTYYLNPETARIAQELKDNPGQRILFDASKDLKPEDIDIVLNLIKGLKAKEGK